MSELEELRARVRALEDVRAVEQAMHDYWYALDFKQWDALEDCFTEDVEADYGRPDWRHQGRAALVEWLRANESGDHYSVSHAGHNPRTGGFTNPPRAAKEQCLGQLVVVYRILQGSSNVLLAHYLLKSYRTIFPC